MPSPPPRPKAPPIHWDLLSNAPGPTKKKPSIVVEDRDPTRVFSTKYFAGRHSKRGGRGPQSGRSL